MGRRALSAWLAAALASAGTTSLMALAGLACSGPVAAQGYPSKPVRLVIPFPAGGPTDTIARALGQRLSEALGQPVLVDNKPGAGGAIGSEIVARAPADGHTIVMGTTSTHSIGPALNPKTPYHPEKDFVPVAWVANAPNLLIVSNTLNIGSVKELVSLARAQPGRLNYSSSGVGTISHMSGQLFASLLGLDMVHVPYKGVGLALPDLVNGQVALMFDSMITGLPQVRGGKVRGLAVSSRERSALAPEIPTLAESGVPGYESQTYYSLYAPAGTPAAAVSRLNAETVKALQQPAMRELLAKQGVDPAGGTPEQFAAHMRAETAKWSRLIRDAKMRIE